VLLRVTESNQVDMVMGPGSRDRGAKADEIPESLPGVGFVQIDGIPEAVRVRFAYIDDDYIGAYFQMPVSAETQRALAPVEPDQAA
jgi:DNA segregation ATPase FtsK/SpoIIIE, S-DNA-T family